MREVCSPMVVLSSFAVECCRPFDKRPVPIDDRRHAQRHDAVAYRIGKRLAELIGVEPIKVRVGEEPLAVEDTGVAKTSIADGTDLHARFPFLKRTLADASRPGVGAKIANGGPDLVSRPLKDRAVIRFRHRYSPCFVL